jgi:hypothetical protein
MEHNRPATREADKLSNEEQPAAAQFLKRVCANAVHRVGEFWRRFRQSAD